MAKKLYYKIGEACKILDIQPYVLRYWETEFPLLSPNKSKSGQRVYSSKELEVIRRIKELLYEEGYTIAGAKKKLEADLSGEASGEGANGGEKASPAAAAAAEDIAADLERLRKGIKGVLGQARRILTLMDAQAAKSGGMRGEQNP